MITSVATLRWLIYEVTAGEERFHIVARPYEIKTQNEGV
jgi:hypothetical protein